MPKYSGLINKVITVKDDVSDITVPWHYSNHLDVDEPKKSEQQLDNNAKNERDIALKQLKDIEKNSRKSGLYQDGRSGVKARHNFWVNSIGSKQEHEQRWERCAVEDSMKPKAAPKSVNKTESDATYSVSEFNQDVVSAMNAFVKEPELEPKNHTPKRSRNEIYEKIEKGDTDRRFQEQLKRFKSENGRGF